MGLISRQAAIRWVKTECNPYGKPTLDYESGKKVMEHLEQMPSAEPEIIRCKDCKYVGTDATCCLVCNRDGMGLRPFHVYHDDFCSYAERRTDERPN